MEKKDENFKFKVVILISSLILLIIFVNILKSNRNIDSVWNYKEITSAKDVISKGKLINDRSTYYQLEEIIIRFLNSNDEGIVDVTANNYETVSYKDYYDILTDNYKRFMSRDDYEKKALGFINKFIDKTTSQVESHSNLKTKNIITSIYEYDDTKYLCVLSGESDIAYIGIKLNENEKTYNIFYIE